MRRRRSNAGFSLIEAAISAGALGLLVIGLASMYTRGIQGMRQSESLVSALELSGQLLDVFSTAPPEAVPACTGAVGCADANGALQAPLPAAGAFACTRWADGPSVPRSATQQYAVGERYRVDTVVGPHPDNTRYPDARLVTISVCWAEPSGRWRQYQERRLLVPGA